LSHDCPNYAHFPVLVHAGQKLSKQNFAPALNNQQAVDNLMQLWRWLGLTIERDTPERMLAEASAQWSPSSLQTIREIEI
ncbi:MAG: hypothetical protein WD668_06405, partial [Saccharospirillum sp.]